LNEGGERLESAVEEAGCGLIRKPVEGEDVGELVGMMDG
jgi:hypothetical protein